MGKKKYDKIELVEDHNSRIISYYKRIKGLVKKSIELAVLCDQECVLFVVDHKKKKMLHYMSNPETDITDLFNKEFEREFITNLDF